MGVKARPALGIAIPALLCLGGCTKARAPELPVAAPAARMVWLDQGWSEDQRHWYHHASQGTSTIPVPPAWFMALERPQISVRSPGLLSDPDYLSRFGFIPGVRHAQHNPDGLPVGFARSLGRDPVTGAEVDQLGLTCAACHTGRIDYQGTAILIDGGPALIDLGKFRTALALSVGLTEKLPLRFRRFAGRVLGPDRTAAQETALKQRLARFLAGAREVQAIEASHAVRPVEEGFGRLDALNRIGNEVFGMQLGVKENIAPNTAPVAFPHLWSTGWFDWVQYNGSIEQPMIRNAGEAMGVRALVNFSSGASATPLFTSTIKMDTLHRMETLLMGSPPLPQRRFNGLRAPAWPQHILPPVDAALAARGAALYRQHCQNCHLPPVASAEFWVDSAGRPPTHWSRLNAAGHRYLRMPMIPVSRIGTDPAQALDMAARTVTVPAELGLTGGTEGGSVGRRYPFGPALGDVVEKVVARWYDTRTPPLSAAERDRMNGHRSNGIRAGIPGPDGSAIPAYKARPLDGIWATPPYLHNGSVPTLYDLLSPLAERPAIFHLGSRAFDPVKVGYRTDRVPGAFRFDTSIRGNWNRGHLFDSTSAARRPPGIIGPRLSPDERRALVEYLKTL